MPNIGGSLRGLVQSWKEWVAVHGGGAGLGLKPSSEVTATLKEHHNFAQLGQNDDSLGQGVPALLDCGAANPLADS